MGELIKLLFGGLVVLIGYLVVDHQASSAVQATAPPAAVRSMKAEAAQAAARAATETIEPNEIEMIAWRRSLMGKPGLQMYVVFFNDMGQPVDYFVTKGKCSSSGKRLLRNWRMQRGQTGVDKDGHAVHGDFVMPAPAEDGLYGVPDEYVFCRTVDGKYKQWNGRYYISDAPIELAIKAATLATERRK